MIYFFAFMIPFMYLGVVALWSPVPMWWIVTDSPDYINMALSGCVSCIPNSPAFDFCRAPLFPYVISILGIRGVVLFNTLCAGIAIISLTQFVRKYTESTVAAWFGMLIAALAIAPIVPAILSDSLCIVLLVGAVAISFRTGISMMLAIIAGVLLGLAAITREAATVWLITLPLAAIIIHGRRSWVKIAIMAAVAVVPPAIQSVRVYSHTGIFSVATFGLSMQMYPLTAAEAYTHGTPAEMTKLVARLAEQKRRDMGPMATVKDRVRYEWDHFFTAMKTEKHGLVAHFAKAPFYIALSSPRQWEAQFPGLIPRWVVRIVMPPITLLFLLGSWGLWTCNRRLFYAFLILVAPVFAQALLIGPTVTSRTLLPAIPITALLTVAGFQVAMAGLCSILSLHSYKSISSGTRENGWIERIRCRFCGDTLDHPLTFYR